MTKIIQDTQPESHDAEFGLMTFVSNGKAMSLEDLKIQQKNEAAGLQEMADIIREENEIRQKMRADGIIK